MLSAALGLARTAAGILKQGDRSSGKLTGQVDLEVALSAGAWYTVKLCHPPLAARR